MIKAINKRQTAKSDRYGKPSKKANTGNNPSQPVFQPVWYPPSQGLQPTPLPSFTPPFAPIPQPRPYRQFRPTAPSYPSPAPYAGYGSAFPGFSAPSVPSPSFGGPPRGATFSGTCYNCHQFRHRSSECPNLVESSASNAGRFISEGLVPLLSWTKSPSIFQAASCFTQADLDLALRNLRSGLGFLFATAV
jgi:hypothetical protein